MDLQQIINELTRMIDGEEYIVSQVRVCRKCKMTLPLDPRQWANVEEYLDKENRIILWQHKDCPSQNHNIGYSRTLIDPNGKTRLLVW